MRAIVHTHSVNDPDPSGAETRRSGLLGDALLSKSGRGGSGSRLSRSRIVASVREARALWAHQLHASLLNTIGAAIVQSQVCEQAVRSSLPSSVDELTRLGQILRVLEDATRALAAGRTEVLRDLPREVRARTQEFAHAHPDIQIRLSVQGEGGTGLSRRVTAGTSIVLAEALANAGRHAAPSAIEVHLALEHGSVLLRVRDDGCGFDEAAHTTGLGLAIMRQWADALSGRLVVSSVPGRGTQVTLHAPLKQSDAHR